MKKLSRVLIGGQANSDSFKRPG